MKFFVLVLLVMANCVWAEYKDPHMVEGRTVIIHLFEWKWNDIADECERFLGPKGYGGVQISPPTKNVIMLIGNDRPWYERYHPLSYNFTTRSGNEEELANMIRRCNNVGVRIYADVVFNHMGSIIGELDYPEVPYGPNDFNRYCEFVDPYNPDHLRDCSLVGLPDLNQTSVYVRGKISCFLNRLIYMGVAGFRIDGAKHMWPSDLKIIYESLQNLSRDHGFSRDARPYIYQEVIDLGGEGISKYEYTPLAAVTEFRFSAEIGRLFRGYNQLKWLETWGTAWGFVESGDGLGFVDNHDNQRGHGAGGADILTYKTPKQYRGASAFGMAHPYGQILIMSSFDFVDPNQGPPADADGNIIPPTINPDGFCGNGWVCEHRWRQMYAMARFRNEVGGTSINNWWYNAQNQIAFCRGDRGFIAFNNEEFELNQSLQTCLSPGNYCDIISGIKSENSCTGKTITVDSDGTAQITIGVDDEDMMVAIHAGVDSKL